MTEPQLYLLAFIISLALLWLITSLHKISSLSLSVFIGALSLASSLPIAYQDSVNIDFEPTLYLLQRALDGELATYMANSFAYTLSIIPFLSYVFQTDDPRAILFIITFFGFSIFSYSSHLLAATYITRRFTLFPLFLASFVYGWGGFYLFTANIIRFNVSSLIICSSIYLLSSSRPRLKYYAYVLIPLSLLFHPALIPFFFLFSFVYLFFFISHSTRYRSLARPAVFLSPIIKLLYVIALFFAIASPTILLSLLFALLTVTTSVLSQYLPYFLDLYTLPDFSGSTVLTFALFLLLSLRLSSQSSNFNTLLLASSQSFTHTVNPTLLLYRTRLFWATWITPSLVIISFLFGPFYRYAYLSFLLCSDIYAFSLFTVLGRLKSRLLLCALSTSVLYISYQRFPAFFDYRLFIP